MDGQGSFAFKNVWRILMIAHPHVSRPFPRGRTAKGEEVVILTWRDLEFFSQVHVRGDTYRTYCPIHNSDQERCLSIDATTGFGHCFGCEATVFVADFDPQTASRLQQRKSNPALLRQKHSPSSTSSRPQRQRMAPEKPPEEWQLLSALQAQGALHLDLETAWNAQAYLEARHIPVEIAHRVGVAYVAPEVVDQYGEWLRPWNDRLLFPLLTARGEIGFTGRLLTHWQSCRDASDHQARLRAEGHEPWRKTGVPGWFWDSQQLPHVEPIVVVDGPFDRLAVLAAGGFEPGDVVALVGMTFQPAWLSGVSAILFALNRSQSSKEAVERLKHQLTWNGGVRGDMCRSRGGNNWSECWRREGEDGLEILYGLHARLAHGL
jgi:hypothetical protein